MNDLRFAIRQLRKAPGFALVAVLTLALGIGANTAIFSVIDSVLLRPLPFPEPSRLVAIWETNEQPGAAANLRNEVARGNFYDWRAQNEVFENIAALGYTNFNLSDVAEPERIQGAAVSYNFFQTLGVAPAIGRPFQADEEKLSAPRPVIIGHELWQRRFGGDASLVGRTLRLNGESFTVVGIMPAGFELQFPTANLRVEMWTPLRVSPMDDDRKAHFLYVLGRLKDGVSREHAQAAMNVIAGQLRRQYPDTNSAAGVNLVSLHQQLIGDVRPYLYLLFAAVGFVLLIACVNVANLVLARLASRKKELGVRLALGASRGRLIRQLLTESIVLAVLGGALGLLFAAYGVPALQALAPPDLPRLNAIRLHQSVFFWTVGVLLFTSILFGFAPALEASNLALNDSLKENARSTGGLRQHGLRRALVISEVALALLLLAGAGLMIRSSWRLRQVDPGFEPTNLLTLNIALPRQQYSDGAKANAFFNQLLDNIRRLPGVMSAGGVDPLPMSGSDSTTGILIEGEPILSVAERPAVGERTVTPDYFEAMGIALLEGRTFRDQDRADSPRVVVVNEALARRFFPGTSAMGRRLGLEDDSGILTWAEIVGVVGNVKHQRLADQIKPEMFEPYQQAPRNFMSVIVRSEVAPASLISAVRSEVVRLDKDQPVFQIRTMEELLARTLAQNRFVMLLLTLFSAVAVILAVIGIYGVMSYFTTQRRKEIGIRLALGAQKRDVVRLVLSEGMLLALVGIALGLLASSALTQAISHLLFGVSPTDPITLATVAFLLAGVALLACWIPARRASRVDPMVTLRAE